MESDDSIERAKEAKRGSPFLSPKQAAHYLGVSLRTLQVHRTRGTGPRFRRHCQRIRYHIDDLDSWSIGQDGAPGND
ncbi:helix-turn-helix domain-containing protein [Sphingopyxis granuli]|uniref:helix-turn-helix domain-containing protein n=1 Tax=Sphingopyxis granuli TaxID=267128 RepID=UPI000829BF74|nr:helix-turn-helix domain-containing protein [Sphingopyxis granuli]